MQPHLYSFKKLIRTMMCESQLCIPISWSTVLKWLNFVLWKWPFSVIFWSRNVKRFWKKAEKNSNSWREIKIVKIFLMFSLLCKKRSWKNVSKIALLENNQKHFLRYTLVDVHLKWLNWFYLFILMGGQLIILVDRVFLSIFLDVTMMSMPTFSFLAQLDFWIPCLQNAFLRPLIQMAFSPWLIDAFYL